MAGGEIAPASGVGERIEDENCRQLGLLIRIAVNKPTLFTIDPGRLGQHTRAVTTLPPLSVRVHSVVLRPEKGFPASGRTLMPSTK
jgi:hypothetical protein